MDIKVVNDKGQIEENKPIEMVEAKTQPFVEGSMAGELEYNAVGQMFDLKPSEIGLFRDKIGTLLAFARTQTDDHTIEGLKWAIRSLQNKVGTPPLGEKMINYLNKYAYLKMESNKLQKDIEKYEHNN